MNPAIAVTPSTDALRSPVSADRTELHRRGVRVREARFEDRDEIAALQTRNKLNTTRDWPKLWSGNPAYKGGPIGWVLETPGGKIVGFLGNVPLDYEFRGTRVRAATAHSWAVDAEHRGRSVALLDRFLRQPDVDLFVFTTVNTYAEKVLRAFRFQQVPAGRWDLSAFWVTGHRGLFRSAVRALRAPSSSVSAIFSSTVQKMLQRSQIEFASSPEDCTWREYTEFDNRFDELWENLQREQHDKLVAVRDRVTLEWHYQRALDRNNAILIAAEAEGRLMGYAVFDRIDHVELDLKRLRFADFQARAGYEALVYSALEWMLRRCNQEGIHVAENLGCWLEGLPAPLKAPFHRKMKSWLYYYKTRTPELAGLLRDGDAWAVSSYDGDASLS